MMSLDERQKLIKRTFSRKQLDEMSIADLVALVGEAGAGAQLKIKAVVKRADGSIKYDETAVPGDFGETIAELEAPAAIEQHKVLENAKDTGDSS